MFRAVRIASDYNRALPRPIRLVHVALAAAADVLRPAVAWTMHPRRRDWAAPLTIGAALFLVLHPFDGVLGRAATGISLGGDVRRELHAWQQFGALGSVVFAAAVIWLLDPDRRRRLLDLLAAVAVGGVCMTALKMTVGRPRPRVNPDDPWTFLGPWGQYPLEVGDGQFKLLHAWQKTSGADLWSMPSSHTAHAAILAVFLWSLYPRLRPLGVVMVGLVGASRVLFNAHWPTDVIVGGALGFAAARVAVGRYWGVRGLDWFWKRAVDRQASPALPRVLEVERSRLGPAGPHAGRPAGPGTVIWLEDTPPPPPTSPPLPPPSPTPSPPPQPTPAGTGDTGRGAV